MGERVVVAVSSFLDGETWRPHDVVVVEDGKHALFFDFNHCRRDDCTLFHQSGSGPVRREFDTPVPVEEGRGRWRIWLAAGWVPSTWNPETRQREAITPERVQALGVLVDTAEAVPDPFADAQEGTTRWCTVCDDHLPDDNDFVCDHVWWCETFGGHVGPGETDGVEPCGEPFCLCARAKRVTHA